MSHTPGSRSMSKTGRFIADLSMEAETRRAKYDHTYSLLFY